MWQVTHWAVAFISPVMEEAISVKKETKYTNSLNADDNFIKIK